MRYFDHLTPGSIFDATAPLHVTAAQRAANGSALGDLLARLVQTTDAGFAYADIASTGWVVATAPDPTSVVHPAPDDVRPWDFLWSITAWGGID